MANYIVAFLMILSFPAFSAIDISCPQDVTVHLFDIDLDYETYGDPVVNAQGSYVVDKDTELFEEHCEDPIYTIITYTATDENGESSACEQRIDFIKAVLEDVDLPEDVDFDGVTIEEAQNDASVFPDQWEILWMANFLGTYDDHFIYPPNGSGTLKIKREWAFLDWCTAQVIIDTQTITIFNFVKDPAVPFFTIDDCKGRDVDIFKFEVYTDQTNFQLNLDNCFLSSDDFASYLNCIAEHNDISPDHHFIIAIEGPNDHLNGVSTLDLLLTQRDILDIKPFETVCASLSADTNNDGSVTALDILIIRKLILGIIDEFPDSPAWKIFNAKILEQNIDPEEQDLKFKKDEFPLSELELISVKTGDVNRYTK